METQVSVIVQLPFIFQIHFTKISLNKKNSHVCNGVVGSVFTGLLLRYTISKWKPLLAATLKFHISGHTIWRCSSLLYSVLVIELPDFLLWGSVSAMPPVGLYNRLLCLMEVGWRFIKLYTGLLSPYFWFESSGMLLALESGLWSSSNYSAYDAKRAAVCH